MCAHPRARACTCVWVGVRRIMRCYPQMHCYRRLPRKAAVQRRGTTRHTRGSTRTRTTLTRTRGSTQGVLPLPMGCLLWRQPWSRCRLLPSQRPLPCRPPLCGTTLFLHMETVEDCTSICHIVIVSLKKKSAWQKLVGSNYPLSTQSLSLRYLSTPSTLEELSLICQHIALSASADTGCICQGDLRLSWVADWLETRIKATGLLK